MRNNSTDSDLITTDPAVATGLHRSQDLILALFRLVM